ncbi:MAG: FG-GAP-like repeat-containing protein [bacterium]
MRTNYVLMVWLTAALLGFGTSRAAVPLQTTPFWQSSEVDVYSTGMIWEDVNNDGFVDAFFSNGNDIVLASNFIYVSRRGQLPLSASWYSLNAEYSGHCSVGDIDDNGLVDFVAANFLGSGGFSTPNTSTMYLNAGGLPHRGPDWRQDDSAYSFSCALGDPDGDGDLDLALATGEGYTSVYERDCIFFNIDGVLQTTPGWQSGPLSTMLDVTWGDVDNDGDLDLAFTDTRDGSYLFYNDNGIIESNPSWSSANSDPGNTLIFGDVNGDGWLDLIVAYNNQLGGGGRFVVYFNNGSGTLATNPGWQSATGGYGSAVSLYDFDNDGDDDLAAGRWWDRPRIYENTGSTFTTTPIWQAGPEVVVEELAWIDIDGDGVEMLADTISISDGRHLVYTKHHPLNGIDSVVVDGTAMTNAQYCYDLVAGWVSVGVTPSSTIEVYYRYSFKCDLTDANWDTYNLAFANTNEPYVDFYADTTTGWAPLTVQFTDSSVGATDWNWQFTPGDLSSERDPLFVFDTGGSYDISLKVELADGWHHRVAKKMILALADTLYLADPAEISDGTLSVAVVLRNTQPVERIEIPISYGAGDLVLTYAGFDTDGCRTAYFDDVTLIGLNPAGKRLAFRLSASGSDYQLPLPPGRGSILNLHFTVAGMGTAQLDTVTFSGHSLEYQASFSDYLPIVVAAQVGGGLCGDANGDGVGPDIADLVYLVNYMFNGGPVPPLLEMTDVDGNGVGPDIADLVYLVNYMFNGGPALAC